MVSTMPSTVIGFTNEAAPSIAVAPAGSSRHSATLTDRYWEYIPPPAAATTLPSRARAAGDPRARGAIARRVGGVLPPPRRSDDLAQQSPRGRGPARRHDRARALVA